jgi:amino acid transporter/nucleotide-binding universal stress UspA family protein
MPNNTPPTEKPSFARDLGLFDATMIGIGAMIGAGIFVLTGIASGEAGPASILAFALNGLVTLLTAFVYAELASTIPRAGGGYSFVRMAFPGGAGFVAGWMLWFAYTVACSLYALGFAGYFWEFFHRYVPAFSEFVYGLISEHGALALLTVFVGLMFIALNARGAEVTGKAENALTLSKLAVLGIFIFFGIKRIMVAPEVAADNFVPFLPNGLGGVFVAMGLTFIAFEGYDLIATVAEEIKQPEINIPKATFISLGVTVVIYLLILWVSLGAVQPDGMQSWEFLGKFGETAIVRAAEDFMPAFGVMVIVIGGLLSTMSALNATVMAASRVAFSMSRDRWLPKRMSEIHPKRRTPQMAIIVTGAILLLTALLLPIETVGSAASLMFLLTFAMVNLSLIVLRRKYPELPRRFKVPLYPVIPILGFSLNIFLALYQFSFQPIAWFVTLGWIAAGLFLYYAVFEKGSLELQPQVLMPGGIANGIAESPCVLIALHNPDNVNTLLNIGIPLAKQRGHRLVATSIVEVPRQVPIHDGMRLAHHKEPLLNLARKVAKERGFKLETDLVIAHHAADGIQNSAERNKAEALVMGWKGFTNARDRMFGEVADKVIRHAPCDLFMLKVGDERTYKSCLLPTSGGPNAMLAAAVIKGLAEEEKMSVTATTVVAPNATSQQRADAERRMDETMARTDTGTAYGMQLIESKSIAGGIAKASRDYDLVVIGAAKEPMFRKMLFGEIPEKVARYSPTSVLVVKKYEGIVKSLLKRVLG